MGRLVPHITGSIVGAVVDGLAQAVDTSVPAVLWIIPGMATEIPVVGGKLCQLHDQETRDEETAVGTGGGEG